MSLINLIVILVVIGMLLFVANRWLPMDPKIRQILNVVVVLAVILWLLAIFLPGVSDIRVPR